MVGRIRAEDIVAVREVCGIADTQTIKREPGFRMIPNMANAPEAARKRLRSSWLPARSN
jgi:hypothetical protein